MQIYSPTLSGSTEVLGPLIQTGSLTSTGTITAPSLVITSTTQFTGSVSISGSLNATSSWASKAVSASYALSSSLAANAVSASYALSSSLAANAVSASYASGSTSASYALNSTSASYTTNAANGFPYNGTAIITGSLIVSGSSIRFDIPSKINGYSLVTDANGNATWQAVGAAAGFPFNGAAVITGSLLVSGSGLTINGTSSFLNDLLISKSTFPTLTILNSSTTSGYPFFKLRNNAYASISNGNRVGLISLQDNFESNTADISFYKSGSSSNIVLQSPGFYGYVGIGTSTPTAKLEVNGNSIINGSLTVYGPINGTANAADNITGYQVADIDAINYGTTGSNNYSNIIRSEELEQSKHTTINIFNFLNFS